MAFVVQMIFWIAGSKQGAASPPSQGLRQAWATDASFPAALPRARPHRGRPIRRCRGVDSTQTGGQGLAVLPEQMFSEWRTRWTMQAWTLVSGKRW